MKCNIPKLIEKQTSLQCGKHAINNLLQQKLANCNELKKSAKNISKNFDIPLNELLNTNSGYYDVSVLVSFLQSNNYQVDQLQQTDFHKISRKQSPRLIGYIFGDGHHWMSLRKTNIKGCYFIIDSLIDEPIKVDVVKKWLEENPKIIGIKVLNPK